MAFPITPGSVEEIHSLFYGEVKGFGRLAVVGFCPSAHAPHAIADFTYFPIGSSESPVFHQVRYKN
jgi:hypothetical protein